jgi:hypothetical protein
VQLDPTIAAALIGLGGGALALIIRDIIMALLMARKARSEAVLDRSREAAKARLGDVRTYADPLLEATKALKYRLNEIIEGRNVGYLLASAPETRFIKYKRLSTAYRLASLLGWLRAFRRERSYLDPEAFAEDEKTQAAICKIEDALADGQGVESQRLEELSRLWRVDIGHLGDEASRALAIEIEAQRHRVLTSKRYPHRVDHLAPQDKLDLVAACASLVREATGADLPPELVEATADQAILYLQIREAYIYRDWQAAIGDFMIREISDGPRRFDVLGFGSFEDTYLEASEANFAAPRDRWFERIEALFHDLDMKKHGMFDARRKQLQALHAGLEELETVLRAKIAELAAS